MTLNDLNLLHIHSEYTVLVYHSFCL